VEAAKQTTELTSQRMISKISDSILPQSPDKSRNSTGGATNYASPNDSSRGTAPDYSSPSAPPAAPEPAPAFAPAPAPAPEPAFEPAFEPTFEPAPAPAPVEAADDGASGFSFMEEPAVEKPAL
jgi:hypothetical protein